MVVKSGTVNEFFGEVREIQGVYRKHRRQYHQYHHQRDTFNETLATLEEGQVVFVVDFQEHLQLSEQDEVQSQHWQHESVTIFPAPLYFKMGGRVWCYSFQVLSDDRTQENVWVQYHESVDECPCPCPPAESRSRPDDPRHHLRRQLCQAVQV